MNECEFCMVAEKQIESETIYEDDKVVAVLHLKPAAKGHVIVFPKGHFPIIEQVPDDIVEHTFSIVNRISMAIFESMEAQGSNIIVQNGLGAGQGIPHFSVNIIPRRENDKLNLQWEPKKMSEDDLAIASSRIANEFDKEQKEADRQAILRNEKVPVQKVTDYRSKQLNRIP